MALETVALEAPVVEVVNHGGEPWWRFSGSGAEAEDRSGAVARALWMERAAASSTRSR